MKIRIMLYAILFVTMLGLNQAMACNEYNNYIAMTVKRLTGPGHCDGEIIVKLTNNSNTRLYVSIYRNGEVDSGTWVRPGATVGGEMDGLFWCHASTDRFQYKASDTEECTQ